MPSDAKSDAAPGATVFSYHDSPIPPAVPARHHHPRNAMFHPSPRLRFQSVCLCMALSAAGCRTPPPSALQAQADATRRDSPQVIIENEPMTLAGPDLEDLVRFTSSHLLTISPQIIDKRGPEFSLRYVLSEDGRSIETRIHKGAFDGHNLALDRRLVSKGDVHYLQAGVRGSNYYPTLALWTRDAQGQVDEAWVRTTPLVLIKYGDVPLGETRSQILWKPIIAGKPVGDWAVQ